MCIRDRCGSKEKSQILYSVQRVVCTAVLLAILLVKPKTAAQLDILDVGQGDGCLLYTSMVDEQLKKQVIQDVTLLKLVGFKPIIVHGGGKEISKCLMLRRIVFLPR